MGSGRRFVQRPWTGTGDRVTPDRSAKLVVEIPRPANAETEEWYLGFAQAMLDGARIHARAIGAPFQPTIRILDTGAAQLDTDATRIIHCPSCDWTGHTRAEQTAHAATHIRLERCRASRVEDPPGSRFVMRRMGVAE